MASKIGVDYDTELKTYTVVAIQDGKPDFAIFSCPSEAGAKAHAERLGQFIEHAIGEVILEIKKKQDSRIILA